MKEPTKLAGQSALTRWLNLLLGYVKSLRVVDGPNYSVKRTPRGTTLTIAPGGGSDGGKFDYILCRNGEQIRVKIASDKDPTTVAPDTGDEDTEP